MKSRIRMTAVLLTAVAAILYAGPLLLDAPLTDPDEGLHAAIAQEMRERGDFIVPRFLGSPFLDKPVLFFWAQLGSMSAFGMNTAAARAPGLFFAVLGIVATGWVAGVLFNPLTAWIAATCYATMALPFLLAQAPVHDMALVPFTNMAFGLLWKSHLRVPKSRDSEPTPALPVARPQHQWVVLAGVVMGLSILTKGLEGVAIVGLGFAAYLILTRAMSWRLTGQGIIVLVIAILIAAPWFLAMEARTPGYLRYYFVGRHLLGFVTETQRHGGQPWWFYIPLVAGGGLPWVAYIRPSTKTTDRTPGAERSPVMLLRTWLIGAFALLSLSGSKAVTYILPALPAVAILAACAWVHALSACRSEENIHALRVHSLFHAALFLLVALAAPIAASRFASRGVTMAEVASFAAVGAVWVWVIVMLRRRSAAWAWPRLVAATAATYAVAFALLGPAAAEAHSARDLATYFNGEGRLPGKIYVMDQRVSFVYYLRRTLRAGLDSNHVQSVSVEQLAAMNPFPRDAVVALPADLSERMSHVPALANGSRRAAGRYVVISP